MQIKDQITILWRMALRNITRRVRRSLIVAATGSVGMICVLGMQGFINGMYDSMVLVAVDSGLGHVQIRPKGYLDSRQLGLRLPEAAAIERQLQGRLPANVSYAPRMEREAMLRVGADTRGMILFGIDPARERQVSSMPDWVIQGSFLKEHSDLNPLQPPCLVGTQLARDLEVETGDWTLLSTGGNDGSNKTFRCKIVGVFKSPAGGLDKKLILMRRTDLSRIRNDGPTDEVNYLVFRGSDLAQAPAIKTAVVAALQKSGPFGRIEIASMNELEPGIADIFALYDQTTTLIYFIILFGFGIVLFESVTMSIFERTQEIGMVRAVGAPAGLIFGQVILETFLLTLGGVLGGLALGGLLVLGLNYFGVNMEGIEIGGGSWAGGMGSIRPYLTLKDPFIGLSIALVVGFCSGIYPALRAVRISPLEAIHGR